MTELLPLIGLATAFIAGWLVDCATTRADTVASWRDGAGPTGRIREGRRRTGGRNKATRTPRRYVRPTSKNP